MVKWSKLNFNLFTTTYNNFLFLFRATFNLLSAAETILQKIKQQIEHHRNKEKDMNRLNNLSIIDILETDEETEREPKVVSNSELLF